MEDGHRHVVEFWLVSDRLALLSSSECSRLPAAESAPATATRVSRTGGQARSGDAVVTAVLSQHAFLDDDPASHLHPCSVAWKHDRRGDQPSAAAPLLRFSPLGSG